MDNQHRKIAGYRELTENEIAQINEIKQVGERLSVLIEGLQAMPAVDQRWAALAKTHLQMGVMFAVRAIAKPTTF